MDRRISSATVGRLSRVQARDGWPREGTDFTPWLAENLDVLEAELGLELIFVAREHPVGRFALDLLLHADDDRIVIVENQLETSDHGHLGRLLAYAAGTKADIVVRLAEAFTDELLAALEWLNEASADGIDFFAVTLGRRPHQ